MGTAAQPAGAQAGLVGGAPPPGGAPQGGATGDKPLDSTLSKIAAFIPGEAVATYIAVLGIWNPTTRASMWGCFGVGMGLVIALCLIGWFLQRKSATTPESQPTLSHLVWVFVFASAAFIAYAMAVPGPAAKLLWSDIAKFGAIAAFILAAVLPSLGKLVGVDPDA